MSDRGQKTLYVDCQAGIAGDMFVASLIEAAQGEEYLRSQLAKLPLTDYGLRIFSDSRGGLSGLRFIVESGETHAHRHLCDIERIIVASGLDSRVKKAAVKAFTLLAEAEAKVHGTSADEVHFHEVGAVDAIVDITGVMIMLGRLGWPEVVFSPLNVGGGTVQCEHGVLPVPVPAVTELLCGINVFSGGEPMERVTPTGAALVRALGAKISESMPAGEVEAIGVGLGSRDSELPNAVRSILLAADGETASENDCCCGPAKVGGNPASDMGSCCDPMEMDGSAESGTDSCCELSANIDSAEGETDSCCKLSANIDDMTPQDLSAAMERLFEAGAMDAWFEHIQMKKNRPAVKLCCLGAIEDEERLAEVFLRETTTFGVRSRSCRRYVLKKTVESVETPLGSIRVKQALIQGEVIKQMPEFDDISALAKEHGLTLAEVRDMLAAAEQRAEMGAEGEMADDYAAAGGERAGGPYQGMDGRFGSKNERDSWFLSANGYGAGWRKPRRRAVRKKPANNVRKGRYRSPF